jgi:hypothetical protein
LRTVFERFQLQVRYHKRQKRATVRVALSDDSLDGLLASVDDIEGGAARQDLAISSAGVPEGWGRRLVIEASFERRRSFVSVCVRRVHAQRLAPGFLDSPAVGVERSDDL